MERGALPGSDEVGRLVGRALSLALATFAVVGVATFILEFARRHDSSSDLFAFGGWQVDLAVIGIASIGVALLAAAGLGMRRFRPVAGTPRSYQALAALIAFGLGIAGAQTFHRQPERAYNWAAGYTAGAKQEKAQDTAVVRQMMGDATHPPQPFGPDGVVPFPAAPAAVAVPLLRADDLGADWYSQGPPRGTYNDPDQPGAAAGIKTSAQINLAQEKWNGTRWVEHLGLLESVRHFFTAREARSYTAEQVGDARLSTPPSQTSSPRIERLSLDRTTVWLQTTDDAADHRLYLTVGSFALLIDVISITPATVLPNVALGPTPSFPATTDRQIVAAAVTRAEQATRRPAVPKNTQT